MIPYGRQDISEEDIDAVVEVLRSNFLTQGPAVPSFEQRVAGYAGAHYAVAVNSATSALHLACLALDVGPGDWVWTSPITFVASANCGLYCGASIGFVDIDPRTYNLCPRDLERRLAIAATKGCLPKVVVAAHLCGQSCDMVMIHALAQRYGFRIIEDASHAIGGRYRGDPVGNCRYSDITVFSFHPVKIITSAEGGMAVTNDERLAGRMSLLRSHGITRDAQEMTQKPDGPWYYQQIELGFNYRMTDMQAALGLSQMDRIDAFVGRRHELAGRYDRLLQSLPVTTPWQHLDSYSAFHLYVIRILPAATGPTHLQVFESLREQGIGVNLHYIPVYRHPYYERMGFLPRDFPQAEEYYAQAISLPMFPGLEDGQVEAVVGALQSAMGK